MLHNQNIGILSVTVGIDEWKNLRSELLIDEDKEIPKNAICITDKHVNLRRVVYDKIINKRKDIVAFALKKNYYNACLISNLLLYLGGHKIVGFKDSDKEFFHLRHTNAMLLHSFVWSNHFSDVSKKKSRENFLLLSFSYNCDFVKKNLIFDPVKNIYSFKVKKEICENFFDSKILDCLSFNTVDDEDYLCGKFADWVKFIECVVSTDLEERLYEIIQNEESQKFAEFTEKFDHQKDEELNCFTTEHIAKMSESLISFRDDLIKNDQFLRLFSKKESFVHHQHFFGNVIKNIDCELSVLKENPNISKVVFEKYFARNHEMISDLLLIYDSQHISDVFKNYFEVKVNFSKKEIHTLFDSLKKSQNAFLSKEVIWQNLRNEVESEFLDLSKNYTKKSKEFDELLDFVEKSTDINSKKKIKEFIGHLQDVSKVKIACSRSIAFHRALVGFLYYVPFSSLLCSVLHPSKTSVKILNQSKKFYGTKFSKSIRKSLNISQDFKYLKKLLSHTESSLLFDKIRKKYHLMSRKDAISFAFKSKKKNIKAMLLALIFAIAALYLCGCICKVHNIALRGGIARLFYINKIVFELMIILFLVNVLVECVIKGLVFALIVIAKYLDQFLFGRLIAKILNLVKSILLDTAYGIFNFFGDVFASFIDNGFESTMVIALNKIYDAFTTENFIRTISDFFKYVVDRFQAPDLQENPYVFSTYSFSIFNIVGSLKKMHNFLYHYRKDSYSCEISVMIKWVHSLIKPMNLQSDDKCNKGCTIGELYSLLLHDQVVNFMLQATDHRALVRHLNAFYNKNIAFALLLKNSQDETIKALLQSDGFHVGQYLQSFFWRKLTFMYPKLDLNTDVTKVTWETNAAKNSRIMAIDWCIERFKIVNQIVMQHCRIFKCNNVHLVVQQALEVYKNILQCDAAMSVDTMRAFDGVFAVYLNNALSIIIALDKIISENITTCSAEDFCKAFSGNLFLKSKNKDVKAIENYIASHYKKRSILHNIPHIVNHGFKDLFSVTTLISILLCQIPSVQMLAHKLDLKTLTRVHELHHLSDHLLEKSFAPGACEIAELVEMLKTPGEMYEDWVSGSVIMTTDNFCAKAMSGGRSPDAKHISKIKRFLNSTSYHCFSALQFNAIEDFINKNETLSSVPSTKICGLLRLDAAFNNKTFSEVHQSV